MSLIYSSDNATNGFDATTVNSLPAGWTAISGSWAVKATSANLVSAHAHDFEDTSQGAGSIDDTVLYTGNGTAADMDVTFAQVIPAGGYVGGTGVTSMGCYVRSDIANQNGYLFLFGEIGGNHCVLFKKVSGTLSQIGSATPVPFTPVAGQMILARMVCLGTFIAAKIWRDVDAEPTSWTVSQSDASVTAAGYAGLRVTQQIPSVQANCSDFNVDSIASSSDFIFTLSPASIAASGGNIAVSGTYSGTAPIAADVAVDGGSYTALAGFTASGGNFSGTVAAPANGIHSLDVRDHSNTAHSDTGLYIVTGSGGGGGTSIAPNDAAMVYSPYNWHVTSGNAKTVNPGAYFKTLFTGTTAALSFDVSHMQSPASQIWWRIDNGTWAKADIAASVTLTILSFTLGNADVPYHLLEVIFKGQDPSSSANRWDPSATGTALNFTGLVLDSGAAVTAPSVLSKNLLVFGDSLVEGIRTVGQSAANPVDQNDAQMGWAYQLGQKLGCEVGVVGEGGTGFNTGTFAGVPNLQTSYGLLYSGQSRTFSPAPDLIVCNHGVNDAGASATTTAATAVFNALLAATPSTTRIVQLQPLPAAFQSAASYIQAAVTNIGNARLTYVATTGILDTALGVDSSLAHPSGPNDEGVIAPQIAALLSPALYPATGGAPAGGFVIGG